jgi:hypothetical protein
MANLKPARVRAKITTCPGRIAAVLHELQIPFEVIEVDMKNGEHKAFEYLNKQAVGHSLHCDHSILCSYFVILTRKPRTYTLPALVCPT